jgi:hypothetical protein
MGVCDSGQSQYWYMTQMKLRVPYAIPIDKEVSFFLEVCRPTVAKIYLVCIFRTNHNKLRVVLAEIPAASTTSSQKFDFVADRHGSCAGECRGRDADL